MSIKQRVKLATIFGSTTGWANMILSAIISDIVVAFPTVSQTVIQMLLTVPSVVGIVACFAATKLEGKIKKKWMLIFVYSGMIVAGFIGLFFSHSIIMLMLASIFLGFSKGSALPISLMVISDYFEGEEKTKAFSNCYATVYGFGGFMILASMFLARYHWHYSYAIFLIGIPFAIAMAILLPNDEQVKFEFVKKDNTDKNTATWPPLYFFYVGVVTVSLICSYCYSSNVSLVFTGRSIPSSTLSGIANCGMAVTGFLGGLLFTKLHNQLGHGLLIAVFALNSVALFVMFIFQNLPGAIFCSAINGFCAPLIQTGNTFYATESLDNSIRSKGAANVSTFSNIGVVTSPIIINFICPTSISGRYLIAALGMAMLAFFMLLRTLYIKKMSR